MSAKIRRPAAVIFDLDGVLLDTEPLYTEAINRITLQFGKPYTWETKSKMMGTAAAVGGRIVIESLQIPLSVEDYLVQRDAHLRDLFEVTPAIAGAQAWVEDLEGAGLPVAVATSSVRELCEVKWRDHPWLRALSPFICGNDPGIENLKPAPDIYLEAAKRLGQSPEDCLVFEDSPAGVQAALAAGMQVIALKAPELPLNLVAAATLVISSYSEVTLATLGLLD